jgi:hypothetical protein
MIANKIFIQNIWLKQEKEGMLNIYIWLLMSKFIDQRRKIGKKNFYLFYRIIKKDII